LETKSATPPADLILFGGLGSNPEHERATVRRRLEPIRGAGFTPLADNAHGHTETP
jgi:hypothetical protein